jgi:hypothetical protein
MLSFVQLKIIFITLFILILKEGRTQQVITNNEYISINSGSVIQVIGDVKNEVNAILNNGDFITKNITNDGTLSGNGTYLISGNFINNGILLQSNGKVVFNGDTQYIGGNNNTTFHDVEINSTNFTELQKEIRIEGDLYFTNGLVKLNQYDITYAGNLISGNDEDSYAETNDIGRFIRNINSPNGSYQFPVGNVKYTPITITFQSATLNNARLEVLVKNQSISGMNNTNQSYINRHWDVEPIGITNPMYDVAYKYHHQDVVGPEEDLFPIRKSSNNWFTVQNSTFISGTEQGIGSVDTSLNLLSWQNIPSFSLFSGAGNYNNPLPVEFGGADVVCNNHQSKFIWTTISEINNSYFEIQIWENDSWELLGRLNGVGNSNIEQHYEYELPYINDNKYQLRLIQFDINGLSEILVNHGNYDVCNVKEVVLFPNPALNFTQVSGADINSKWLMMDSMGRIILSKNANDIGNVQFEFNFNAGIYYIQGFKNGEYITKKLIIK